jgi:hypothetical protein
MSEKFTPGPWKWWTSCSWRRLTAHNKRGGDYKKEGDVLCPTKCHDGHPDLIVTEADMALIAASPDLYTHGAEFMGAVEALCDWMNGNDLSADHAEQKPGDFKRLSVAMEAFRAALAKARGES